MMLIVVGILVGIAIVTTMPKAGKSSRFKAKQNERIEQIVKRNSK